MRSLPTTLRKKNRSIDPPGGSQRPWVAGLRLAGVVLVVGLVAVTGCAPAERPLTPLQRAVLDAATPILTLDPDADWTAAYNRLVALGPASVTYLASRPEMTRPAPPDSLAVLLHTSLVRLLSGDAAPRISATCLEKTLAVLHFDVKINGLSVGDVVLPAGAPVGRWHDLYPAHFDHRLAARMDLEADRQALRTWIVARRDRPSAVARARLLRPQPEHLWHLLGRRYADYWFYEPLPAPILVAVSQPETGLLRVRTREYNLVRAACIQLGGHESSEVETQLIESLADPSPVVRYNARFALGFSKDARIRAVIERYNQGEVRERMDSLRVFAPSPAATECYGWPGSGSVLPVLSSSPPPSGLLSASAATRSRG